MEFIASETRIVRKIGEDLLEIVYYDNAHMTVESARRDIELYDRFTGNKRYKKLVIGGMNMQSEVEARKLIATENARRSKLIIAEAIVLRSKTAKLMGQMYLFFLKRPYPVKIFSNREDALKWLEKTV